MTDDSTQATDQPTSTNEDTEPSDPEGEGPDAEASAEELRARVQELQEQVDALESERDELNERLLRKAAEFDNFRRRMDREKKRRYEAGRVDVIEPILEVLDDFERSLNATKDLKEAQDVEAAFESLKGGVEMVFRKFLDTLETLGVEPIEAEGKPFDEEVHEAMMRQPTDEAEPGTVLKEIRKGYRTDDRIIRHSRVVVAAKSSASTDGEADEPTDDAAQS